MTQDEIIEMARQAGCFEKHQVFYFTSPELETFAKLVAAKEREACAKVCDSEKKWWSGMSNAEKDIYQAIDNISACIRARGET